MSKNIAIIAGETSGDHHGAKVLKALNARFPDARLFGMGGDRMIQEGLEPLFHIKDYAFMGFWEVIKNLSPIKRALKTLQQALLEEKTDLLVLIDYPGFNLRMAKFAKNNNIPVLYYISPQVWAWKPKRIHHIVKTVTKMAVIFPFEVPLYEKAGLKVDFVGHPLLDESVADLTRETISKQIKLDPATKWIGIFPGSRHQEISKILPAMVDAAERIHQVVPDTGFCISCAPNVDPDWLKTFLPENNPNITFTCEDYRGLMTHCHFAMVTSGTATLETALAGLPMVVVYKTSFLTWLIGRWLINLLYISLANIVSEEKVVPELIQYQATGKNISTEIIPYLQDSARYQTMKEALANIAAKLGSPGAANRVATLIQEMVNG